MRRIRLLLVMIALFASTNVEADTSERIRHAENSLRDMQAVLNSTTNDEERVIYEKRVQLAEKMLSNARQMAALQKEEDAFASEQRTSEEYRLLEALSTIDTSTNEPLQEIRQQNKEIRRLKQLRSDVLERLDPTEESTADNAKVLNLNAEILARTLERDAFELQLRMAREAARIDASYRTLDLNPRPTVRLLHQKRQNIRNVHESKAELELLRSSLEMQKHSTRTALDLAHKQLQLLEDEIHTVRSHRDTLRRDEKEMRERMNEHLNVISAEKDVLTTRLLHIPAQLTAIDSSIALLDHGEVLLDAEADFLSKDFLSLRERFVRRVMLPFALALAIIIAYALISRLLFPILFQRDNLFVARRLGGYTASIIVLIILISFFLEDLKAIATVMGIVGAAVVIALQDLCSSFAGWFVIVASRKLKVGDRVEIANHRGDVIDVQMLRTTLLELNNWLGVDEPTGRIIIVPNSFIFKNKVFNYSHVHPYIWGNVDITVTFETPPQEAYDVLLKLLEEETTEEFASAERGGHHMIEEYGLVRTSYVPHIHSLIEDSGVKYSLFYVTHFRRYSATRDKIVARVLKEFENNPRLEFAYPTERHIRLPGQ